MFIGLAKGESMAIFVSEPARPGLQRLPELLRRRRVNEAEDAASSAATASRPGHPETGGKPTTARAAEQRLARRAVAGYQNEAAEEASPDTPYLPVARLVVGRVFTVDSSASLADAKAAMAQHGIKHIIVLHRGTLAGLMDLTWVLERQVSSIAHPHTGTLTLAEETLPAFITATPETDAHELARQMLGYRLDCAVVVDQSNQVAAVVTASDYLRLYSQQSTLHESI